MPGTSGALLMTGAQGFLHVQISKAFLHTTLYRLSQDNADPLEALPNSVYFNLFLTILMENNKPGCRPNTRHSRRAAHR